MWQKMMDLDNRAKKSNKEIKEGFRIIKELKGTLQDYTIEFSAQGISLLV